MNASIAGHHVAGMAFDCVAEQYDELFTHSLVGRAQRSVVWEALDRTFSAGDKVLELNCGTGEDALHLARRGVTVVACDASPRMIEVARRKVATETKGVPASFHLLPTERVVEMAFRAPFDGIVSNFAGLNCVEDLADVADQLASMVRPDAWMLLCVCSRFCLWEMLANGVRGDWRKAFRRCGGSARAQVCGMDVAVQYPTVRQMKKLFSPWFRLRYCTAVGFAIPPSYMEEWSRQHRHLFQNLLRIDGVLRSWPLLRTGGDHVLLAFQRCDA